MPSWRMLPEVAFLRRKVARRILLLFVLCALLPVTGLAAIAFFQVTAQLSTQSSLRLRQASKATAMSIVDRLELLEGFLATIAGQAAAGYYGVPREPDGDGPASGVQGLAVSTGEGNRDVLYGRVGSLPSLSERERAHLRSGRALVSTHLQPDAGPRILMWLSLYPHGRPDNILVADLDPGSLWGAGGKNTLPPSTDLCVLNDEGAVLVCTLEPPVALPAHVVAGAARSASENFEWTHLGRPYLASYWSIPMMYRFGVPRWTVVVSEARADVLAPMAQFSRTFPLVALLSLWVVLLLSLREIRRTLEPLEQLKAATRSFATRDFTSRVTVTSGDEFEELALSFNAMADRLGKQFGTLAALGALDRAILSSLDAREIAATLLTQMRTVLPCDEVRVTLAEAGAAGAARTYVGTGSRDGEIHAVDAELTPDDIHALREHREHLYLDVTHGNAPGYLADQARGDISHYMVCPIFLRERLAAVVSLGYVHAPAHSDEDRAAIRQVADQLAVALANAADVAERKRAEQRLQESKRRLEQALADLKATQQQVLQQERLLALGQMASGVAHDFNNTLTPILGYTELLLGDPRCDADPEKRRRFIKVINTAAKDAANVVRRLREFYRSQDEQEPAGEVDLNALIEEAIVLAQPRWRDQALAHGAAIRIETSLSDVARVAGVEPEIREVLTNLIFNAVDAMPRGGTITLRTRRDGDRVALDLADTGTGMSEEVRRRCLEPFFSTKGKKGTGLGLAMVYGIVNRHEGSLAIESAPGQGTTFTIHLPVWTQGAAGPAVLDAEPVPRSLEVLLVDDDPGAREVVAEYLTADGHVVRMAGDGREAWETFLQGRFDLVITDQAMPEMNGDDLAAAIKQVAPAVPVILLSGFADFRREGADAGCGADIAVGKPITLAALRQAVAHCMRARSPNAPVPGGR